MKLIKTWKAKRKTKAMIPSSLPMDPIPEGSDRNPHMSISDSLFMVHCAHDGAESPNMNQPSLGLRGLGNPTYESAESEVVNVKSMSLESCACCLWVTCCLRVEHQCQEHELGIISPINSKSHIDDRLAKPLPAAKVDQNRSRASCTA